MSIRTLIEINHDHLSKLQDRPALLAAIMDELGMSTHNAALNEANGRGRAVDIGHGVRIVCQYHHTNDVTITTDYAEVKL